MIQIQSYTHSFSYHTIFIHHMSHNSSYDYVQPVNMLKEQDPAIINTMISSHMEHHNQTRSSPTNAQQHGIDSRLLRQQRRKKSSKQPKQSSNQRYNPTKGPRQTHKTNVNPSTQQHIRLYGISHYTLSMVYQLVNQAVAKVPHIASDRFVVTKLQKQDRLTVFKLTGPNVINEQFITQLRTIGTKVGMRIQVMNTVQKRPIRPGKRIHHSSWNIATLNINSLNSKIIMLLSFIQQNDLDFIALQETQRTTKSKMLTIPRYSVIESTPDKLEKGVRGMALLVKTILKPTLLENPTSNFIWVQFKYINNRIVVCNVYVPAHNAPGRKPVLEKLAKKILYRIKHHPQDSLIILGDFNMKPDQLKKWIGQWKIQCTILPIPEGQCTYRKGSTVIDYILCYQGSNLTCSNATIYEWRDEPLSDHNALYATLMINNIQSENNKFIVNRYKVLEELSVWDDNVEEWPKRDTHGECFINHSQDTNDSSMQVESESESESESKSKSESELRFKATEFIQDLKEMLKKKRMVKEPWKSKSKKKRIGCIPKELVKLLEKCRRIRREKAQGIMKSTEEQVKDKETLMEGKRALRQIMKEKELRDLQYGLDKYSHHNSQLLWKWIRGHTSEKRVEKVMVIRNPTTGKIEDNEERVAELWANHYRELARDVTGHSKDPNYWLNKGRLNSEIDKIINEA